MNGKYHCLMILMMLFPGSKVRVHQFVGRYPDRSKVYPKGEPVLTFSVNLDFVEAMRKALKEFSAFSSAVTFELYEDLGPIRVRAGNTDSGEFEAIIMPMRIPGSEPESE